MRHCDEETLALLALGDAVADEADTRHLRQCAACRAELDQLTAVVRTGRRTVPDDAIGEPPVDVWREVKAALDLPADLAPFVPSDAAPPDVAPATDELAARRAQRQRRQPRWYLAAAAAAGIAMGSLATWSLSGSQDVDTQNIVATSSLTAVQAANDGQITGEAVVVERSGQDYLQVEISGLGETEGFYEVWLLKPDLSGMVPLGALASGSAGQFVIPPGVSIDEYSIVDISDEPLDGDPAHSKDSRARGEFGV